MARKRFAPERASGQDRHSLVIEDPGTQLFMNRKAGDFRLRPGSPAIDSGSSRNAPPDDFLGTRRPVGAGIDKGAFEWIQTMGLTITRLFQMGRGYERDSGDYRALESGKEE